MPLTKVINVWADNPDFTPLSGRDSDVQKIVVGDSPTTNAETLTDIDGLPLFQADFQGLTHLYLWRTRGFEVLPALPDGQLVLEIRSSQNLTTIHSLPASLETLIVEDCAELQFLPDLTGKSFRNLRDLSLARCPQIDADWIASLIKASPDLRQLDLSECRQLRSLPAPPPAALDRLELNGCTGLKGLPEPLPQTLRRLGLRDAKQLREIPDLPGAIDYVDLALTQSLQKLPGFPRREMDAHGEPKSGKPRTLFLFGSGVLEPPASEHGAELHTNVAAETREYQDEVDRVGKGTVKRCKALLLGNGEAGKTFLALNLHPHFDSRDIQLDQHGKNIGGHYAGTTHGIQLWDWPNYKATKKAEEVELPVNLHLWDFGGQEIYHSTHRLFVSRGSVFLVVWNPDQDGQQPKPIEGVQDVWYPVRYWLDYIHAECPHNQPLIAIVCSHQGDRWQNGDPQANEQLKAALEKRLRKNIGDEYADRIPLFVLDSKTNIGERTALEKWLARSIGTVVELQGTVVPTYWEVAQDMVDGWLQQQQLPRTEITNPTETTELAPVMSLDDFTDHLGKAIQAQLDQEDTYTNFDLLRACWNRDDFLTDPRRWRVPRTLRFLTHSGWLYWGDELFESRVIINQPWALQKAYACLERRPGTFVYQQLTASQGRFTFTQLQDWCHDDLCDLDETDQRLIMTFMESVGVCFRVTRHWYGDREDTVYISPTHLPQSDEVCRSFETQHSDSTADSVPSNQLHRGHWFAILRGLCKIYGDDATYTRDACLIHGSRTQWDRGERSWTALLRFILDEHDEHGALKIPGLGGEIAIRIVGPQVEEGLATLQEFVQSFLPGYKRNASAAVAALEQESRNCLPGAKTVFFSYAWDPVQGEANYTEPVDVLEKALQPLQKRGWIKELLRDKSSMKPGDYIREFIANAGSQDVDLVLVFTSDRYWRSWWCMLEFVSLLKSLQRFAGKGIDRSVLVIQHESGKKLTAGDTAPLVQHWKEEIERELVDVGFDSVPKCFPDALYNENWRKLRTDFIHVLTNDAIIGATVGLSKEWTKDNADEIIAWVKDKLEIPDETP